MNDKPSIHEVEKPAKKPPRKKPNMFLRLLAFLVTLALVLGAVAVVVYRDRLSLDALRRWYLYRSIQTDEGGQATSFHYDGNVKDGFAALGSKLVVCGASGVRLYGEDGAQGATAQAVFSAPVVQSAGTRALAYDAGGDALYVCGEKGAEVSILTAAGRILAARVNSAGQIAVTTRTGGHKGTVTVYGPSLSPLFQTGLSSSFLTDALVSSDGKTLSAIAMGKGDAGFESRLNLYQVEKLALAAAKKEEPVPDASYSLGSGVVLDLEEDAAGYWVVGDSALTLVGTAGAEPPPYDYDGQYLKDFSLGGESFAALLLGKYRAGTVAELVVVDATGAPATLEVKEQVLSLSAAGRYLAVLTADRLDIYTADLKPYATLTGTQGARKVLMRGDGTAMLIGSTAARLYIPG